MFIGIDKLFELINDPQIRLVEFLSERDQHAPEGTGLDLRIGRLSRFGNGRHGHLGTIERQTPDIDVIAEVSDNRGPHVELLPHEYYLATTIERVNMPLNLVGLLCPRGTLFRSGVILSTGQVNPGYCGTLTFGVFNAANFSFELEMGARIAHLLVAIVEGSSIPYRGQWQNGRISTDSEIQT